MKDDTQNAKKETLSSWLNPLVMVLSAANVSMSGIVNLVHLISQPIGITNILLGNIGTSVFFNTISLTLNTCSLVNHFRVKNLYKRFNYEKTLEEKRKGRHKIQGIALDIVCDVLFLTGAVASIALLGNPIALAVAAPFITLGCIVMVGNIAKSTYHQVQRFKHHLSQFSREEQEEMRQEMQKEINSSRLYRIMAKVLPDSIVLAKLYDSKANKAERKEIARLERMLKRDSNNSSFSKAASDNIRPLAEPVYDEKFLGEVKMSTTEYSDVFEECRQAFTTKLPSEIELCKRSNELNPNHDLPSSQLSLDESAITKKETENTLPSF